MVIGVNHRTFHPTRFIRNFKFNQKFLENSKVTSDDAKEALFEHKIQHITGPVR